MAGIRHRIVLLASLLVLVLLLVGILRPPEPEPGAPSAPPDSRSGEVAGGTGTAPDRPETAEGDGETGAGPSEAEQAAESTEEGGGDGDYSLAGSGPVRVAVRVLDHEGRAVATEVAILMVRPDFRRLGVIGTGEDGSARGFLPGPGIYIATAEIDGTRREARMQAARAGESLETEIRFPGTAVVSGRVRGESGGLGEDIHGEQKLVGEVDLMVEAFPRDGGRPLISPVDESGRYRISGLAAGPHILAVRSKFHAESVEVEEGMDLAHDIVLPEGSISGRAFEEWSGEPGKVAQVVVQLARAPSGVLEIYRRLGFPRLQDRLSPDADGRYAFTNLPEGEYVLFASGIGYGITRGAASISPGSPDATLDFPLKQGAEIMLSIRDPEGHDLQGAVCMTGAVQFRFTGKVVGFTVGAQDFLAWAPGRAVVIKKAVKLVPDRPAPVDFVLPRAAITELHFVDPEGNDLPGVRVSVPKDGHDLQQVLASARQGEGIPFRESGPDGIVLVSGAVAGTCRVTARKSGFALFDEEVELPEGGGRLDLELLPASTSFRLRVRISGVHPGGQADLLGLLPGDVVVSYAGKEVSAVRDLQAAIEAEAKSPKVQLVVERSGERRELEVSGGVLGVTLEEFEE